ncbi:bifunctional diguanylate cyclase/phosphodiesterase [Ferrimicrobium acidiphilum]|uniref:bifunctional diguanylate cyclase/phosphodiesterase n=1 Tax=Ferrimicrobium acidiphilum TaxID=121039 RepID=UPI0023F1CC95|nr:bifunctional diguanylate cyclase/phosphodiesterase [Ferrimicrobium acidiphilum]
MHRTHPLQPWFGNPAFVEEVITATIANLDQLEPQLAATVATPLILALTPSLLDPVASRKSAELTAVTLQRLGYSPSVSLALIESLAHLVAKHGTANEAATIERQRQRLQARAVDSLHRRQRAELQSALALSHHDPLTGLMNRRGFVDAMSASLQRAQRSHSTVAIAILDLGTLTMASSERDPRDSDRLLVELARQLDSLTRSTDTIARLGGATFALLVEGDSERTEMLAIVERELRGVGLSASLAGQPSPPTWHAGLAVYPHDGTDSLALLSVAEAALVEARTMNATPGLNLALASSRQLQEPRPMTGVYSPIGDGGNHLEVRYQPIVDLTTGSIAHLEALVRLKTHAGIVGPEDFIDSLARDERRTLFEVVLSQVADDIQDYDVSLPISVNIEPDLVSEDGYAESIIASWAARSIPAHLLTIEITETQDLVSLAYGPLALLKAAGHRLALDDFGAGYASLSRIMSFPFDEIKLDRAFSEPIDLLNVGLPLMTVAIDMSQLMDFDLVIEGIEDPRVIPVLRTLGARLAQGYALSRPLSMADVLALTNPLPLTTDLSHSMIAAAVQVFRWERAVLSLAASEGATADLAPECIITDTLVDPDLIRLHQAQHLLAQRLLLDNDSATVNEFCRLGRELRQLVSTRLATD